MGQQRALRAAEGPAGQPWQPTRVFPSVRYDTAMKAVQLLRTGNLADLELRDLPEPIPGSGEVVVALRTAALNRPDWWTIVRPSPFPLPATPGSDGAGVVSAIGAGVSGLNVGDEVVIIPALHWGDAEDAAGPDFQILGVPSDGTFATKVAVPAENVLPKPSGLTWEEAAALNLAGLTAWRAVVTHARPAPGRSILVAGAGSGASTFLIQIATAFGARVLVTSSASWKIDRAVALGATGGVDYGDAGWPAKAVAANGGPFDVVIDSAGAAVYPGALQVLRRGGTLVSFGGTSGNDVGFNVRDLYYSWKAIVGTTMGSPREYAALLAHVETASWRPVVDSVFPFADFRAAFDRLNSADRFGKVVLSL